MTRGDRPGSRPHEINVYDLEKSVSGGVIRGHGRAAHHLALDLEGRLLVSEDAAPLKSGGRVSSKIITDGQWHHFAALRQANGSIELFLDGQSQGTAKPPHGKGSITSDRRAVGAEKYWIETKFFLPAYFEDRKRECLCRGFAGNRNARE